MTRKMKKKLLVITFATFLSVGYYILAENDVAPKLPVNASVMWSAVTEEKRQNTAAEVNSSTAGLSTDTNNSKSVMNNITDNNNNKQFATEMKINNNNNSINSTAEVKTAIKTITTTTAFPVSFPPNDDGYPFGFILNKPDLCSNSTAEIKLVILVVSTPANFNVRSAIRKTWGQAARRRDVRLAFALGGTSDASVQKRLYEEDETYADLLQENFVDSYRNLTLKTIMLVRWVHLYCPNTQYLLKVDDDNFVNVPNLLNYLAGRKEKRVVFGKLWKKVKPIRDKKSKWYVTEAEFKGDHFPDYAGGPAYCISADAIPDLLAEARSQPQVPLEDVFLTGICAEKAKINRVENGQFHLTADNLDPCTYRSLVSVHGVSPSNLFVAWWYTNDDIFDSCASIATKDDKSCDKTSKKMLVDLAGFLTSQVANLKL